MNRITISMLVIGIVFGSLFFYEKWQDQKVYEHMVSMSKQSVDSLADTTTNAEVTYGEHKATVTKREKVNELTLKSYLKLDEIDNAYAKYPIKNNPAIVEDMSNDLKKRFCNDEKIGSYIGVGLVNMFDISYENGEHTGEFTIDKKACELYMGGSWVGAKYAKQS